MTGLLCGRLWFKLCVNRNARRFAHRRFLSTDEEFRHDLSFLSRQSYWNRTYRKRRRCREQFDPFEWLVKFDDVQEHIWPILQAAQSSKAFNAMDLGCGTSHFMLSLVKHLQSESISGTLLDFSTPALDMQRELYMMEEMDRKFRFVRGDVTRLPFGDAVYDLVIDKGTMDSLAKDEVEGAAKARCMFSESTRILKKRGYILQVTDEDPELRLQFITDTVFGDVHVSHKMIEANGMTYYIFVIQK